MGGSRADSLINGIRNCQATDATGCLPGNAKHIGSMEVDVSIGMDVTSRLRYPS